MGEKNQKMCFLCEISQKLELCWSLAVTWPFGNQQKVRVIGGGSGAFPAVKSGPKEDIMHMQRDKDTTQSLG